jgi:hypothetical protein
MKLPNNEKLLWIINRISILIIFVFGMSACQPKSEIDKCIEAKWELFSLQSMRRAEAFEKEVGRSNGKDEQIAKEFELEMKLVFRMECLRAQGVKG